MPDSFRRDDIPERTTRIDNAQSDALVRLRAEVAARAVLDREAAKRDIDAKWAREQVAATRPKPPVSAAEAARNVMISRTSPGYQPPVLMPVGHAARVHAAAEPAATAGGAAAARSVMMRRAGR